MERFRLPRWVARDGLNEGVLGTLWEALQRTDPALAAAMLHLETAAGRHLDNHGAVYGLVRRPRETDSAYRQRILAEVLNPRSTALAIKDVVEAALDDVTVTVTPGIDVAEQEGLKFFDGTWNLDGSEAFRVMPGGAAGVFAVFYVDIEGPNPDLIRARAVIERIRAAGYIPIIRTTFVWDFTDDQEHDTAFFRPQTGLNFDGSWNFDGSYEFGGSEDAAELAVGNDGTDALGQLRPAPESLTALRNEVYRNTQVDTFRDAVVEMRGFVDGTETSGPLSEVGIFDTANNLVAYATFAPQSLVPGTRLSFRFLADL